VSGYNYVDLWKGAGVANRATAEVDVHRGLFLHHDATEAAVVGLHPPGGVSHARQPREDPYKGS
jgi:hypothetical protein